MNTETSPDDTQSTDYPRAVLDEADAAAVIAFSRAMQLTQLDNIRRRSHACRCAAQIYAAVLAKYTVAARLAATEGGAAPSRPARDAAGSTITDAISMFEDPNPPPTPSANPGGPPTEYPQKVAALLNSSAVRGFTKRDFLDLAMAALDQGGLTAREYDAVEKLLPEVEDAV